MNSEVIDVVLLIHEIGYKSEFIYSTLFQYSLNVRQGSLLSLFLIWAVLGANPRL